MTHVLNITREDPVIHLKAYGGTQIEGVDRTEVQCEINAPQLATLVEEDGHVYITVNSSCNLKIPMSSLIEIEKGMGSIKIVNIKNRIQIEKALGNLVLMDVGEAIIEKVGGNFAVRNASGDIHVEKVGGNLIVDNIASFSGEKIGGSCRVRDVQGDFVLEKVGGDLRAQKIGGVMVASRAGGSYIAGNLSLGSDVRAGGDIKLKGFDFTCEKVSLRAGGNVKMEIGEDFKGSQFGMSSGGEDIRIKIKEADLDIKNGNYIYTVGETDRKLDVSAGGSVSLKELTNGEEDIIGDLSDHFSHEESAFSEMVQERINSATKQADAKVKAAEIRLEQLQERLEKHHGFDIDIKPGFIGKHPIPTMTRPIGRKGATDEERLMILKMLQEKQISVDEAEALFKALED